MANQTQVATLKPVAHEVQKLRNAVETMDCLSQEGFSKISSIAKLLLASFETPEGHLCLNEAAGALRTISGVADDIENSINATAEDVGCNYVDKAERRRWDAAREARTRLEA